MMFGKTNKTEAINECRHMGVTLTLMYLDGHISNTEFDDMMRHFQKIVNYIGGPKAECEVFNPLLDIELKPITYEVTGGAALERKI